MVVGRGGGDWDAINAHEMDSIGISQYMSYYIIHKGLGLLKCNPPLISPSSFNNGCKFAKMGFNRRKSRIKVMSVLKKRQRQTGTETEKVIQRHIERQTRRETNRQGGRERGTRRRERERERERERQSSYPIPSPKFISYPGVYWFKFHSRSWIWALLRSIHCTAALPIELLSACVATRNVKRGASDPRGTCTVRDRRTPSGS